MNMNTIASLLHDDTTVIGGAPTQTNASTIHTYEPARTLDELLTSASMYVLTHDRQHYDPMFKIAEDWAIEYGAVFGGDVGALLATTHTMNKDTYVWDLYVDDTWQSAKALADRLAQVNTPHVDKSLLVLTTSIPNREMEITCGRDMFRIFALDRYRGVKLIEVMKPPTVTGFFGGTVMIMPKIFNDIDRLQLLYNPAHFKKWPVVVHGGMQPQYNKVALAKLVREDPRVITIGDYAHGDKGRLAIICDMDDDEIKQLIQQGLTSHAISIVSFATCLPGDFQLRKRTVYMRSDDGQVAICDVFNSTAYELVPFVIHNGTKIGAPLVLARFALIEQWLCQLISATTGANLTQRIAELNRQYELTAATTDPLQTTNFLGVNISAQTVKKKIIKVSKRAPPYYPVTT